MKKKPIKDTIFLSITHRQAEALSMAILAWMEICRPEVLNKQGMKAKADIGRILRKLKISTDFQKNRHKPSEVGDVGMI